jgi:hypothetical protein
MNTETEPYKLIGTHIAIPWDSCIPFFYGTYEGKLKNGKSCKIDADSKIIVHDEDGKWCGTDEISYWLCEFRHVKSLIENLEQHRV